MPIWSVILFHEYPFAPIWSSQLKPEKLTITHDEICSVYSMTEAEKYSKKDVELTDWGTFVVEEEGARNLTASGLKGWNSVLLPALSSRERWLLPCMSWDLTIVFDTNFAADFTIMEDGSEFLKRVNDQCTTSDGAVLPMFTSSSPGWIKYVEHQYPEQLGHLSRCKSPHMMLGALVKSY